MDRNVDGTVSGSGDYVALRKESVDRNYGTAVYQQRYTVALRKESVDRNILTLDTRNLIWCRSPQGERG